MTFFILRNTKEDILKKLFLVHTMKVSGVQYYFGFQVWTKKCFQNIFLFSILHGCNLSDKVE